MFFNTTTNQMLVYNSSVWTEVGQNVPTTITIFEFTATAGQTTFTGSDSNGVTLDYNTASSFVALNGVIIPPEDYTTTSASTLTLNSAANLSDTITIYSFSQFSTSQPYLAQNNGNTSAAWDGNNSDALELTRTDDSANAGPIISLKRNSASPADDDLIGEIQFTGKTDADNSALYGKISVETTDVTDSQRDGRIRITPVVNNNTATNYEFGSQFRLNNSQSIKTFNVGSNLNSGELRWDTNVNRNGQITFPAVTGSVGMFAWDHINFATTATDSIQFAGIGFARRYISTL